MLPGKHHPTGLSNDKRQELKCRVWGVGGRQIQMRGRKKGIIDSRVPTLP